MLLCATPGSYFSRTNSSESSGYRIDTTPPDIRILEDSRHGYKYATRNDEMYARWRYEDTESGILEYR